MTAGRCFRSGSCWGSLPFVCSCCGMTCPALLQPSLTFNSCWPVFPPSSRPSPPHFTCSLVRPLAPDCLAFDGDSVVPAGCLEVMSMTCGFTQQDFMACIQTGHDDCVQIMCSNLCMRELLSTSQKYHSSKCHETATIDRPTLPTASPGCRLAHAPQTHSARHCSVRGSGFIETPAAT